MKSPALFGSPFFTFCIPPALAVLQFLVVAALLTTGFPDVAPAQKPFAGVLISSLFALGFIALVGATWGARQVFYSENKLVAAIGAAFNGLYFLGFLLFFVCVFVTNASN